MTPLRQILPASRRGWILPLCCVLLLTCAPAFALNPHTAQYELTRNNTLLGSVTIQLSYPGKGSYLYSARTETSGLVAFFRDDEIIETSRGEITGGEVKPLSYRYNHKRKDNPRLVELSFDQQRGEVLNRHADSSWSMNIPGDTQDKFSQQLALMLALADGKNRLKLNVADGGRLKTYHYELLQKEPLQLPSGTFNTLKLSRRKGKGKANATYWMAPELQFLPVRIERRSQKHKVVMTLRSVSWD
jgi:hypothetical protein